MGNSLPLDQGGDPGIPAPHTRVRPDTARGAHTAAARGAPERSCARSSPAGRWIVAFAAVELAIPWLFLTRAEQHLTSSTAGLLVASVPLIAGVVYRLSPHTDRLDLWRSIGLLIGFAGVAVLVGFDVGHSNHLALGEMGIVAVGYALGPLIVSRRLSDLPSLGVIGVAMALTALCYAPFALTRIPRHVDPEVGLSVAGLSLICTALAFVLFFALIAEVGPVAVDGHHVLAIRPWPSSWGCGARRTIHRRDWHSGSH